MKLHVKLAAFVALNCLVALVFASVPRSRIAGIEYERHRVVFDYVESLRPGQEISVILGDSRSECCLDARRYGLVNLSLGGATPVEGYYLLSRIAERGVRVDRLILSYAPFHLTSQDTFDSHTRYFGLLHRDFLDSVREEAAQLDDAEYTRPSSWPALRKLDASLPMLSEEIEFRIIDVLSMPDALWQSIRMLRARLLEPHGRLRADPRFKLYEATPGGRVGGYDESPEYERRESRSPVDELYLHRLLALGGRVSRRIAVLVMPLNAGVRQPDPAYFDRSQALYQNAGYGACLTPIAFWSDEFFNDESHLGPPGVERLERERLGNLRYCETGGEESTADSYLRGADPPHPLPAD